LRNNTDREKLQYLEKKTFSTATLRNLHNEELNDLYSSPNIVQVIKSRMRWAGHVALMGRGEVYTRFRWRKLKERDHLGGPDVDGKIMLI
jgi:hypothetical protein